MLTFSMLGDHGRLGNQMFQFSMLKSVALKNNFNFSIPKENHQLFDCFDLKCKVYDLKKNINIINKLHTYREKSFSFDSNVFSVGDNINFIGNYQSEKYFSSIREELLNDFSFKQEILNIANNLYIQQKKEKEIVAVHVRRGDYVNLQNFHPLCDMEYYKKCLDLFDNCDIFIFSDDIKWCKENFRNISKNNITYCDSNNPYVDLCIMSICDHNIIANSSFSWWSAWLNKNKNKKVIAPKKWFGPDYYYHDTSDLIPNDWILL